MSRSYPQQDRCTFSVSERTGWSRRFSVAVPSTYFGEKPRCAKRVAILLDRSGSMEGSPIQQAKRAVEACLASLAPEDQFGIIAFDNSNEFFADSLNAVPHRVFRPMPLGYPC